MLSNDKNSQNTDEKSVSINHEETHAGDACEVELTNELNDVAKTQTGDACEVELTNELNDVAKTQTGVACRKNDELTIEIEDVTLKGDGVGKINGFVVFVPGSFTGDILKIHIVKVEKSLARAKIVEILTSSPFRIDVDCECFSQCGSCVFRHISYDAELKLKQKIVKDTFQRIGSINAEILPIIASEQNYYRNKVSYPVGIVDGKVVFGFYARHSNRIVEHKHCFVQNEVFYNIAKEIVDYCNERKISNLRHIVIRQGHYSKELSVCLVVSSKTAAFEDLRIPHTLNINKSQSNVIFGEKFVGESIVTDIICGNKVFLTPDSFYQINTAGAEKLYEVVKNFAEPNKDTTILDLYCGVGTISMYLAKYAKNVIGVESVKNAVKNAKRGKYANNIENVEFFHKDVKDFSFVTGNPTDTQLSSTSDPRLSTNSSEISINDPNLSTINYQLSTILDPPRTGCNCIAQIAEMKPHRIVMVSCDVATAARDCALFQKHGYKVEKIQPVDMFPRTGNVETVIQLTIGS
ncbi:23S rRNA (uracil-5-)-methyltransferase RumA [Clostridia bacterium]|nr:23S rRNA (uracil-5-)-methyltransferase RumA [Clostridia bacterium]